MNLSRPRMFLLLAALWLAVLASSAAVVWSKHQSRQLFVELQRQLARRDALDEEASKLLLEQSAWSAPGLVEQVAINKLHMATPPVQQVQLVRP